MKELRDLLARFKQSKSVEPEVIQPIQLPVTEEGKLSGVRPYDYINVKPPREVRPDKIKDTE